MRRFLVGLVAGAALGAGTAALVIEAPWSESDERALARSLKAELGPVARAADCDHLDAFAYSCSVAYGDKGTYGFSVTLGDDRCWSALFDGSGGPNPEGCLR